MQRPQSSLLALALTFLTAGWLAAAETAAPTGGPAPAKELPKAKPTVTALPVLSPALHDALQSRKFEDANRLIDAELQKADQKAADYLLYIKGRTLTELKQYPAAAKTFDALIMQHPKSRWVSRARFGKADIYVRQRDYQEAGKIYQAEAERLLSDKRQDELTGIYLEFADKYYDGIPSDEPGAEKKPDYKQALTYYQAALKLRSGRAKRQKIEFRIARCWQELKSYPQAITNYQAFLKTHASDETKDENRVEPKLEAEAQFRLGESLLAGSRNSEARKVWQDFLRSNVAKKAGGDFIAQATYGLAQTYGIPNPPSDPNLELGVAAVESFLKQFPKHKLAAKAEFEIAGSYLSRGRFEQAIARMKTLIANPAYKSSEYVASARRLLGETYFSQRKFDDAIKAFRDFLDQHPTDRNWSAVQRRIIDAEFTAADEQRRQKNYDAARTAWSTFLNKYPLDSRAPRILFAFGWMKHAAAVKQHVDFLKAEKEAGRKPDPRKLSAAVTKLLEEAMADWKRLVSKYPGTNESSHGAYMIGVTLEDYLGRLADALEAYKKVTGAYQSAAQARIRNLTAKQLEIATERKFRSNEKPVIKIRSRNVEKVTVKIHRIDMVDYFRKMHLASGVETLDIALIDPDKSWDYNVAGFEKYRSLTNDVEIPVDGPGVMAVTVSGEKLEATTMVVVSDIDIVVKASRNELFVFAENMRSQKPADGVSLLISDGHEVFAEEVTGKDGTLQKSYEKLKSVHDLRVFAVQTGHAASSVCDLNGLQFAVGLAPKGYLYSDRPAYRAGELVQLKGIIRWVNNDTFTFKEGEKYKIDVYDTRGRAVHSADIELGKFGTFADRFILPATSPQGSYRVHLHQPAGKQSYETRFTVHDVQLEPIQLVIDLPKKVYFRGEKIDGKIALKYYYGTPLSNRTIHYLLSDGSSQTATTDAKGEVKFSFETTQYNESQSLAVIATFAERNISTQSPVFIATRGFDIGVTTRRNVYVSGETFDITAKVTDPAGKPLAADLKLEVFELVADRTAFGKQGEKLVSTHELKSDKDSGEARQTVRLDKAGIYRVRVTGKDQFGNAVSGQHAVRISGDDDAIRLRILSDKHNYKVGDTAKVQLHWREAPALALITYEGAKVLGYRLVTLQKGANALDVPLEAKLAPNFVLSVAVMEKNRLHEAHSEFLVTRELKLQIKPAKTTLKPGDEFAVEITATDPQGKPVSAELTLGLIQANLLDVFSDPQPVINAFFGEGYRQPSVRAFTSATFFYRPTTRGVSKYLLAEQERKQILDAELNVRRQLAQVQRDRYEQEEKLAGPPRENADRDAVWKALDDTEMSSIPSFQPNAPGFDAPNFGVPVGKTAAPADPFSRMPNAPGLMGGGSSGGLGGFGPGGGQRGFLGGRPGNGQPGDAGGEADKKSGGKMDGRFARTKSEPQAENQKEANNFFRKLNINSNGGIMPQSEARLSLIIRQTQTIDNTKLLNSIANLTDGTIVALAKSGEYQVVNGIPVKKLEALAKDGLQLLPAMGGSETGYWNPVVVTGKDGKAVVKFRLPNRSTAWKLRAKGTDAGVLTGETSADVITKKNLFGEVKTPLAFHQGDKAQVLVEVHNAVVKKGEKIAVTLETKIGDRTTKLNKTLTSDGPGIAELTFPVEITAGDAAEFSLTVSAGKETDLAKTSVPVQPYGLPVYATASGSSAQNTIVFVGHDKKLAVENPTMEILIGPSVNRTLLDAVLVGDLSPFSSYRPVPTNAIERNISDVIGGVALMKMIKATRNTDTPEAQALAGRIQSALTSLVSAQQNNGGWSWIGRADTGTADRFLTSRAVWALSSARAAGFVVPNDTFNKAVQYLKSAFSSANRNDLESQAILLHGLAMAKEADFAFANRLFRERNRLQTSALLHLALTLIEMDRKSMATDLLNLVKLPTDKSAVGQRVAGNKIAWISSGVEQRALYLLALQAVKPGDKKTGELADWLMAARRGMRWNPEKANGPAIAALAEWFSTTKFTAEKYTLQVIVNGAEVEKFTFDPAKDGSRRIAVPAKNIVKGQAKQQQIHFNMTGRGRFSYSVVMTGFVPADKLKSTTNDWHVERNYEPAPLMVDGKPLPRGFGILSGEDQSKKFFRNPLTQLPLGERGEVSVRLSRHADWDRADGEREYLVVTEPIPSGCIVMANSVRGEFERFEITPGAITFYVGDRRGSLHFSYTLVGYLPGQYRTVPTVVRSFYEPSRIVVSTVKPLDVLARGEKSKDKYKLSPVELLELGKRFLAKRDFKQADEHLTQLFRNYGLNQNTFGQVVKLLFQTSLEVKKDAAIVEFFEIIKERYPNEVLDFDEILKVATAYRKLGEYERGYLVFRSTIEAAFEREMQIAGFLDGRGEFLRSVQILERLLAEFPAESYVATATYALAQEVYGKAADVARDKRLRDAGLTKAGLIGANIRMLDHFLSTWPNDPAVDQASFAMANSYLDLENYDAVIKRCEKFANRYPDSKLLDSFWYVIGYSRFAQGQHKAALEMCKKVAETKRKDPQSGREVDAANKWQAVYIMGQVYHSLGQPSDAISEYKRVKDRFTDAAEAIEFFTRKDIRLPEVTTVKPGDAAKVDLKFRNVPEANVKVYRIDLLKFGLMQRNLNRITAINLAGIRPFHEQTLKLGDGKDFRNRNHDLKLPLKDEGAYLVVCRGESLYTSGLVLVSPLELQIQEDATSGRVRVTVKDRAADKYARDVHVKVIGSANSDFISGDTDLRGIFVADAIRGTSTVIAKADKNRYAFFRGKVALGNVPPPQNRRGMPGKPQQSQQGANKDLLKQQLQMQNSIFNEDQRKNYRSIIENKSKGVKSGKAF